MSGLKIQLPISFTDNTLPKLRDDTLLTTGPGSLLLIDPAHSSNPITVAPSSAAGAVTSIPNIAWKPLAELLGAGDATSLAASMANGANASATSYKMELSGKGGLHGVTSQTANNATSQGTLISGPSALRDYLFANPNHSYYLSRWQRRTRAALTSIEIGEVYIYNNTLTPLANYLAMINSKAMHPTAANLLGSIADPGQNIVGNIFEAVADSAFSGTAPTANTQLGLVASAWGNMSPFASATYYNVSASYILYRIYLEDLTISGRSYADVEALDHALWVAAMAAGGRYTGDTFTAPATLVP